MSDSQIDPDEVPGDESDNASQTSSAPPSPRSYEFATTWGDHNTKRKSFDEYFEEHAREMNVKETFDQGDVHLDKTCRKNGNEINCSSLNLDVKIAKKGPLVETALKENDAKNCTWVDLHDGQPQCRSVRLQGKYSQKFRNVLKHLGRFSPQSDNSFSHLRDRAICNIQTEKEECEDVTQLQERVGRPDGRTSMANSPRVRVCEFKDGICESRRDLNSKKVPTTEKHDKHVRREFNGEKMPMLRFGDIQCMYRILDEEAQIKKEVSSKYGPLIKHQARCHAKDNCVWRDNRCRSKLFLEHFDEPGWKKHAVCDTMWGVKERKLIDRSEASCGKLEHCLWNSGEKKCIDPKSTATPQKGNGKNGGKGNENGKNESTQQVNGVPKVKGTTKGAPKGGKGVPKGEGKDFLVGKGKGVDKTIGKGEAVEESNGKGRGKNELRYLLIAEVAEHLGIVLDRQIIAAFQSHNLHGPCDLRNFCASRHDNFNEVLRDLDLAYLAEQAKKNFMELCDKFKHLCGDDEPVFAQQTTESPDRANVSAKELAIPLGSARRRASSEGLTRSGRTISSVDSSPGATWTPFNAHDSVSSSTGTPRSVSREGPLRRLSRQGSWSYFNPSRQRRQSDIETFSSSTSSPSESMVVDGRIDEREKTAPVRPETVEHVTPTVSIPETSASVMTRRGSSSPPRESPSRISHSDFLQDSHLKSAPSSPSQTRSSVEATDSMSSRSTSSSRVHYHSSPATSSLTGASLHSSSIPPRTPDEESIFSGNSSSSTEYPDPQNARWRRRKRQTQNPVAEDVVRGSVTSPSEQHISQYGGRLRITPLAASVLGAAALGGAVGASSVRYGGQHKNRGAAPATGSARNLLSLDTARLNAYEETLRKEGRTWWNRFTEAGGAALSRGQLRSR
jgi:hypothetical protein